MLTELQQQGAIDRLRAESVNPQADVWFGAPGEIFDRAARESLLVAYTPTWSAAIDSAAPMIPAMMAKISRP